MVRERDREREREKERERYIFSLSYGRKVSKKKTAPMYSS